MEVRSANPTDTLLTANGEWVVFVYRDRIGLFHLAKDAASARLVVLPELARLDDPESALGVSWVACVIHPKQLALVWSSTGKRLHRTTLDGETVAMSPEVPNAYSRLAHSADGRYLVASGGVFTTVLEAESLRPIANHFRSSRTRAPILLPHVNVVAMPNHGRYTVRPIVGAKSEHSSIFDRPPTNADSVASSPDGARYVALYPGGSIVRFGPLADGPTPIQSEEVKDVAVADDGTLALYGPTHLALLRMDGRLVAAPALGAPVARVIFSGDLCLAARIDGVVDILSARDGGRLGQLAPC